MVKYRQLSALRGSVSLSLEEGWLKIGRFSYACSSIRKIGIYLGLVVIQIWKDEKKLSLGYGSSKGIGQKGEGRGILQGDSQYVKRRGAGKNKGDFGRWTEREVRRCYPLIMR